MTLKKINLFLFEKKEKENKLQWAILRDYPKQIPN
jgi:hypothetical protein